MVIKIFKRWYIYLLIILFGTILLAISFIISKPIFSTIALSLGTGLLTSGFTAGLFDLSNHLNFLEKRKYRRSIELHYLSFHIISAALSIIGEYDNKNIPNIITKLSNIKVDETTYEKIILAIEAHRKNIRLELETIRKSQDYLSLSGFFEDKEIVFLCRSINYYDNALSKENIQFVLENIISYIRMFSDTTVLNKKRH